MKLTKSLNEADKALMLSKSSAITSLKIQYGQQCLAFDETTAQYLALKAKHEGGQESLRKEIISAFEDLQESATKLLVNYDLNTQTENWSLNVLEGTLVRESLVETKVDPKTETKEAPPKATRVSARKPKAVK